MTGLVIVLALAAVAVLAPRYGVDSRDGRDWKVDGARSGGRSPTARHTVGSDLRALMGWLRGLCRRLARAWDAQERAWGACWRAHQPWRGDDPPTRRTPGPYAYRCSEQRAPRPVRDELHWREEDGGWRLHGRMLPLAPPEGEPSARRD